MHSKLFTGSALAFAGAVVVACTITTERPADSSPPPSPPPPAPAPPVPTPTVTAAPTTAPLDAGVQSPPDAGPLGTDAGPLPGEAGVTDAGTTGASAPPPTKKPLPKRPSHSDAGTATMDGGN